MGYDAGSTQKRNKRKGKRKEKKKHPYKTGGRGRTQKCTK